MIVPVHGAAKSYGTRRRVDDARSLGKAHSLQHGAALRSTTTVRSPCVNPKIDSSGEFRGSVEDTAISQMWHWATGDGERLRQIWSRAWRFQVSIHFVQVPPEGWLQILVCGSENVEGC